MLMTRLTCVNKDPLCAKGFIFLCPPVREMSGKPFECRVRWLISASFFCCLFNGWKQIKQFSPAVTEQKFVFVFVWFLAGRKAQRLPKSKQENRLLGLFCSYLSATDMFGETKELRIPADFFTVYRNRFHTVCMWTDEFSFSSRARFFLRARGFCSSRDGPRGKRVAGILWAKIRWHVMTRTQSVLHPSQRSSLGLKLQKLSKLLQTRLPRYRASGRNVSCTSF